MCGVFATTCPDIWELKIDSILAKLSHRGPDYCSWRYVDPKVILAHTRLEVVGLGPVGNQPVADANGVVSLVFNGEIYNYRELAASLQTKPTSDSRVLAELVANKGIDAFAGLRGMYAFVAWDSRDGSLTAVRDAYGIKPLYVLRHDNGEVTLCSEIGPLLLCDEARQVDPIGFGQFLALGHTTNSHTLLSRIRKLDPGSAYLWKRDNTGHLQLRIRRAQPPRLGAESLEGALSDSVRAHLISDVEVGAFLSGGVDSTVLCAIARSQGRKIRTFTLSMPEVSNGSESELAEANTRALGLPNVVIPARSAEMAAIAPEVIRIHGEPMGDAAVLPLAILARHAASDVKVVLTGEGSDEVFGGYGRYRISRLMRKQGGLLGWSTGSLASLWGVRRDDRPRSRAFEALLWGGGVKSHAALLSGDLSTLARMTPATHLDVVRCLHADWERMDGSSNLDRAQNYDRDCWLPNTYLEKTDRATMLSGLEARVPFLDPVVANFAKGQPTAATEKRELRQLLFALFPQVRLPPRKLGLAVNLPALLSQPILADAQMFEISDRSSICRRLVPDKHVQLLRYRCERSPTFGFRVAMLGVWEAANDNLVVQ